MGIPSAPTFIVVSAKHLSHHAHLKCRICLVVVFLTLSLSVLAQTGGSPSDEEVWEMEKVIVSATRTEEELLDVPQHATVITEEEIRATGASNLAEVIATKAGVSVSDHGPEGSEKSVSIRGSVTSQVLVLIDGVRANSAQNAVVDLSLIPLENVERIEIVRGGTSALYGSDAVGGVINIITKRTASRDYTLRLSVENGSYLPHRHVTGFGLGTANQDPNFLDLVDTQKATIQLSHDLGAFSLNATGSFIRAQNGYVFKDDNNENRKRENAELLGGDLWLAVRFPWDRGFVDLSGSYLKQKKGIPGTDTTPSPDAAEPDQLMHSNLHFSTEMLFTDF